MGRGIYVPRGRPQSDAFRDDDLASAGHHGWTGPHAAGSTPSPRSTKHRRCSASSSYESGRDGWNQ